jgi:hypothetical protein
MGDKMEIKHGLLSGLIYFLLLLTMILFISPLPLFTEEVYLYKQVDCTLLVADPDAMIEKIVSWLEKERGYYILKSSEQIIFRLPTTAINKLRPFIDEVADEIVSYSQEAQDLRENFLGLRSGIQSREEILNKNLSYINRANVAGTLAVEQEILSLLGEIESLKGKLRKLETDRYYAYINLNLSFLKQALPENIPSSFTWINSVDFYSFIQEGF